MNRNDSADVCGLEGGLYAPLVDVLSGFCRFFSDQSDVGVSAHASHYKQGFDSTQSFPGDWIAHSPFSVLLTSARIGRESPFASLLKHFASLGSLRLLWRGGLQYLEVKKYGHVFYYPTIRRWTVRQAI
jgi:hypothetical protein